MEVTKEMVEDADEGIALCNHLRVKIEEVEDNLDAVSGVFFDALIDLIRNKNRYARRVKELEARLDSIRELLARKQIIT